MRQTSRTLSLTQVLLCGAAIVTLSMGIRHGFGLWLQPVTQARDWSREAFSFAIAIQNISWGVSGIFAGMVADKFGAFRVIIVGALLYALGLFGMAHANTPMLFGASAGVLIGMAQAGTTFAVATSTAPAGSGCAARVIIWFVCVVVAFGRLAGGGREVILRTDVLRII